MLPTSIPALPVAESPSATLRLLGLVHLKPFPGIILAEPERAGGRATSPALPLSSLPTASG